MGGVFVTGTDTEVGKTVVCGLLARYLEEKGHRVITQKWIQTGSPGFPIDIASHLKLMGKSKKQIQDYLSLMVPYNFAFPASAHLAAALEKKKISAAKIRSSFRQLSNEFDFVIVEGIGGAMVPYNKKKVVIDIAAELDLPIVIVAENKLGAINHTLLTIEAVRKRKMTIAGIIFNGSKKQDDKIILEDNRQIIKTLGKVKILGQLPWTKNETELHKAFIPVGNKLLGLLKNG